MRGAGAILRRQYPAAGYRDDIDPAPKEKRMKIRYLHTMVRVKDLDVTMRFFSLLGLKETRRWDNEEGRFTLVFMAPEGQEECPVELTWNWDGDEGLPSDSRHFGHLAYEVEDIYEMCRHLQENGVTINRPPRDGRMAFVRSPDNISVELLQAGEALAPQEPWVSMENVGHW
jgi:lactoylglutathione lyase